MSAWIEQHVDLVKLKAQQDRIHRNQLLNPKPPSPPELKVLLVIGDEWQSPAVFQSSDGIFSCIRTGPFIAWMQGLSERECIRILNLY